MPDSAYPPNDAGLYFEFFNEIGIIEQLSTAVFENKLPSGFLSSHFGVLNHLVRVEDGRTPLAIANAFQVPKTTMTHTLAGLEKHGLVEMRPNPKDGRSKLVWLTDKGRKFRIDAIEALMPEFMELAEKFPPDLIGKLVPALAEIREYLDKRRDEE